MKITNEADIPLALAVWLLYDDYDYNWEENYISVTRLMRPLRHLILPSRIPWETRTSDLQDYVARALGNSFHAAIERAWLKPQDALKKLGYPTSVIDKIIINPSDEQLKENGIIPIFLEQRETRKFGKYTIGGKFDMVAEGVVNDTKSTSAYSWLYGTRDNEHALQGSLYKWIDAGREIPRITEDYIQVNYIFTDWQKTIAASNPKYPQKKTEKKVINLLSLEDTEAWIENKLSLYEKFKDSPENQIPECTDEELWRSEPKFKYFADPSKTSGRSTKNFDTLSEANAYCSNQGKGIVITVPGEVKRCGFCDGFDACTQKDKYFQ